LAKNVLPNNPLIKDFVNPLFTLLIEWVKSEEVCHVCRSTINAEEKFSESLNILGGMIFLASNGITNSEKVINNLKNAVSSAVDLITKNAYCLKKTVFEVPSED
jgi:predicted HAD superfamily Cof-like phosphohydrolase